MEWWHCRHRRQEVVHAFSHADRWLPPHARRRRSRNDVYVSDLTNATTTWVSQPPAGGFPPGQVLANGSGHIAISADARYVSFIWQNESTSGELTPGRLYRRD